MRLRSFIYHLIRLTGILAIVGFTLFPPVYAHTSGIHFNSDPVNNEPYKTTEFTVDGPGALKVFTISGNIDVIRHSEDGKVKIELYVDRGYAFWSNSKNLDNYRITMLQRGNEVVASVEEKSKDTGLFSDQMTFSFKIYVPEQMSTDLKTYGGHISLDGVTGNHMMKTSGGNIDIDEVKGKVAAYTAGGNISFDEVNGTMYAQTEGGNINVDEAHGEFRLKLKGGDVFADEISGTMLVQSDGGDIYATFEDVAQGISLVTTAGDIEIDLPSHNGFDLTANANRIYLEDDSDSFSGSKNTKTIHGTLGKGGTPVSLQTQFGTVTINID